MTIVRLTARRPLGIPPQYVLDQMQRGRSTSQFALFPLLREYEGALGHTFGWGQIVEVRHLGQTIWRVMPVALWEALEQDREASALTIRELTGTLHTIVRDRLAGHMPPQLLLTDCRSARRRSPHSLLSLLCPSHQDIDEARRWLDSNFLPRLLPELLDACEAHLGILLTVSHNRATDALALVKTFADAVAHTQA